jgi:hypothetical protein
LIWSLLKVSKSQSSGQTLFSTKHRVMAMVICRLNIEGRRDKGQIVCLRDKNVLSKDLVTVFSRGHLGRWFEGSACVG